jgi:preprotein translocase subunit SecD
MGTGLYVRIAACVAAVLLAVWVLIPTFAGKDVQERIEAAAERAKDEDAPPPTTPDPWWVSVLPNKKVNLGLDLQGGIDLTLDVETEEAVMSNVQRDVLGVKTTLEKADVKVDDVRRDHHSPSLLIAPAAGTELSAIQSGLGKQYAAYEYQSTKDIEGKSYLVFTMSEKRQQEISQHAVEQALETIRNRIDETGVKEPSITLKGERGIDLQLPGETDVEQAVAAVGTTAQLKFMMVDEKADRDLLKKGLDAAQTALSDEDFNDDSTLSEWLSDHHYLAAQRRVLWQYDSEEGSKTKKRVSDIPLGNHPYIPRNSMSPYVLEDTVLLTGDDINDAQTQFDSRTGEPHVSLRFKPHGQQVFADVTGANVKRFFAIILDDQVRSAPRINEKINGDASISMGGGNAEEQLKEAGTLALVLRSGALPAPVVVGEVRTVGASLGERAIHDGVKATVLGCALVLLFAGFYYRISGVLADISLVINGLLVVALLATVGATLTLPGICGIALTIGMAVDCNIIIYERIREELRSGRSVRNAIDSGFDRASVAVIDSNLNTLLAGVVLYSYGSGPLKGFAVTLMIGIFTTLFTGVFVTRTLMDLAFGSRRTTTVSI